MSMIGTAEPAQLAILSELLDRYCRDRGVMPGSDRDEIAQRLMLKFCSGARNLHELCAGLDGAPEAAAAPPR